MLDQKTIDNVKISCVIPVYNAEKYLNMSIESLRNQTFRDMEIICINDCSEDESLLVLREHQKIDTRISIINMREHKGAAISRNEGLKRAQGNYVIFLDADDFFYSEMLEKVYNLAEDRKAEVVVFGYERIFLEEEEDGREKETGRTISSHKYSEYDKDSINVDVLKQAEHVPWNKLVKKSFLEKNGVFFQDIPTNNDVFFSLAITLLSSRTIISDQVLMKHYSGWRNSLTQKRWNKQSNLVKAYSCFYNFINNMNDIAISADIILNYLLDDIASYLSMSNIAFQVKKNEYRELMQDPILIPAILESMKKENLKWHNFCFAKALLNHEIVIDREKYMYYLDAIALVVENAHRKKQNVGLWGCGVRGRKLLNWFSQNNVQIDFLIDKDKQKQGTCYSSYVVYDYAAIRDQVDIILVSNTKFVEDITNIARGKQVIDISDL